MTEPGNREPPVHLLLVDDDRNDATLLGLAVDRCEWNIWLRWISTVDEAIRYLEGRDQYADRAMYPFPDVVLVDLAMPVKGGIEFLEWCDHRPPFAGLPVIVLSGMEDPRVTGKAMDLGAAGHLFKPSDYSGWLNIPAIVWDIAEHYRQMRAYDAA